MRHRSRMDPSQPPQTAATPEPRESGPVGPQDQTFRIGEVAAEFGVTLRTLRFYEDKGLLNPERIGVTRLYSRRDRARLKLILLGKRLGFSLDEVKKMIELYDPHGKNETQMRVALEKGEKQLHHLNERRHEIDLAIGELERTLGLVRDMLKEGRQ